MHRCGFWRLDLAAPPRDSQNGRCWFGSAERNRLAVHVGRLLLTAVSKQTHAAGLETVVDAEAVHLQSVPSTGSTSREEPLGGEQEENDDYPSTHCRKQKAMTSMQFVRAEKSLLCRTLPRGRRCLSAASPPEEFLRGGRLTHVAQEYWKQVVKPGDLLVDATCGAGRDALCLTQLAGRSGKLICFDVLPESMQLTRYLLKQEMGYKFASSDPQDVWEGTSPSGPLVHLLRRSHEDLERFVGDGTVAKLICFNLGYFPGGDKEITTQTSSTLLAVKAAMRVVQRQGLVTIVAYPGHPEGERELTALQEHCHQLSPKEWLVLEVRVPNRLLSPVLFVLCKL